MAPARKVYFDPNADAWLRLERKKGKGSEEHVDEVGELRISVLPAMIRGEALALIDHVGAEAERRDSKHRILKREKVGAGLRVVTSENQLAVRIGKKLRDAFKGSKLRIAYSDVDLPIRVFWEPPRIK